MRQAIIVFLLLMAPLAGCLTLVENDDEAEAPEEPRLAPHETDDATQPAANRNALYLHSRGPSDTWMDVGADATDSSLTATITPLTDDTWFSFPIRPVLNRTLNMTADDAEAVIAFTTSATAGLPFTVGVRLFVGGQQVSSGQQDNMLSGTVRIPLAVPDSIPGGQEVRLDVCVCSGQVSFTNEAQLHTDGSSFLRLPIETPVYVDLDAPEGETNGTDTAATSSGRTESDVSVRQSGNRWVASKTVTLTGALDGLTSVRAEFATVNGPVTVTPWDRSTYEAVVTLEGQGDSEQAARERLSKLRVEHEDASAAGSKRIGVEVDSTDRWRNQTGTVHVKVPRAATYDALAGRTVNGAVSVDRLNAGDMKLSTVNGDVILENVRLKSLDARTTNGRISASVESTAHGSYDLSTTNGAIDLTAPDGARHGYDARGENVNGQVTIDLDDTEPVGQQTTNRKHVRTTDFESRSVQVTVTAKAVNGGVTIRGS